MQRPSDLTNNVDGGCDIAALLVASVESAPRGLVSSSVDATSRVLRAVRPQTWDEGEHVVRRVTELLRNPEALGLRRVAVPSLSEGGGPPPTAIVAMSRNPGVTEPDHVERLVGDALDLGPKASIGFALVGAVAALLRDHPVLSVGHFSQYTALKDLRLDCDVPVWVHGEPALGVECKNYRAETFTRVKPPIRDKAERLVAAGLVPVFVCPWTTPRFREEYESLGGVVIETEHYLLTSASKSRRLSETLGTPWPEAVVRPPQTFTDGWGPLPPEMGDRLLRGFLHAAGEASGSAHAVDLPREAEPTENRPDNEAMRLAAWLRRMTVSGDRAMRANELARSGQASNISEAALVLGVSERTLRRDLKFLGATVKRGRPAKNRTRDVPISSYGGIVVLQIDDPTDAT